MLKIALAMATVIAVVAVDGLSQLPVRAIKAARSLIRQSGTGSRDRQLSGFILPASSEHLFPWAFAG